MYRPHRPAAALTKINPLCISSLLGGGTPLFKNLELLEKVLYLDMQISCHGADVQNSLFRIYLSETAVNPSAPPSRNGVGYNWQCFCPDRHSAKKNEPLVPVKLTQAII